MPTGRDFSVAFAVLMCAFFGCLCCVLSRTLVANAKSQMNKCKSGQCDLKMKVSNTPELKGIFV